MIDVILPELPERELALLSEEAPQPSGPRLAGRVVLGGPVAAPVTADLVGPDPELLDFLRTEADNAVYHLLHLSVTCARDAPDPALHSVNLDLSLTAEPVRRGTAAFQPVAWSMTPHQLTAGVTAPAPAAHLGPRLGFQDGAGTAYGERVCLEARRELRSDPGWEIRHTSGARIGGTYRLAMVVRAPRGAVSRAAVAVGATVREGHTLHRFREELEEPLHLAALQ
ncbi:hypothetical protein VT50_0209765 [Streptomyces antioxidans]|uniref:Uncharacterized protein n=1 Tax=Streptomyces antioxidans TaxID=1507734 RepID=A0A1V4D8X2_9ACTN|nr:hypothetical protein [Streptomyces antioxidans]OPF81354.1 hypothetical protein VT50_0209765 [Streptomyces antioxidans]